MKKIMISIRPEWVAKILNGEKTIEIRKTMPKCGLPCEVYIYCTYGMQDLMLGGCGYFSSSNTCFRQYCKGPFNQKVVAKFILNNYNEYKFGYAILDNGHGDFRYVSSMNITGNHCLTQEDLYSYGNRKMLYGWGIDNLEIFDTPKTLADYGLTKAPQSWCYIKE